MANETGHLYALLTDGTTVEIRPASPDDFDAVKAMHEAMAPGHTYMRFFNMSRLAGEAEARRICRNPKPGNAALLALVDGELVGVASYAVLSEDSRRAEVAFAVADHMHHRGIATLLLEHLVSYARSHGIGTFIARTLTENKAMLDVFAHAGLPIGRDYADGVFELTFPLPGSGTGLALDSYLNAVAEREGSADIASLRHLLAPESVAVVGAGRRLGRAGRRILDNIRAAQYAGRVYVVNPRARRIGGERCLASVLDLPEPVDLAVVAVPAAAVLDVAEQCGQRGVRALVVIASGLDTGACADLLATCRRHGMRLVGPDSFGVAVPGIGLDATFAARPPRVGVAGLVMQSGGLGFALMDQLSRLGVGISSFASVGPKLDVSSNDMLLWWEHDGVTKLAVLYIESFGNPRKFARTARRVAASMPVLTVLADRKEASPVGEEVLFEQAGIITARGFGELVEAAALLATQPFPAGHTVAIVSNVGSVARLAANCCVDLGLAVHRPHGLTRQRLGTLVPGADTADGPVNMTATVSGEDFRHGLELLAADEEVHAIIALIMPTGATGDLEEAIRQADVGVPLAAVVLTQPEAVRLLPRSPGEGVLGHVPAYGYPEAAVGALARAVGYGAWRAEPRSQVPSFPDTRPDEARTLTREFLRQAPDGGCLPLNKTADLLRCYGISLDDQVESAPVAGSEVTITVAADPVFGPLLTMQLDGAGQGGLAARLTPLTTADADKLVRSVHFPLRLPGQGDSPVAGLEALRNLLLRVSQLTEDLPEVADLELGPVMATQSGVAVTSARITAAPYKPRDPFLRQLR